MSYTEAECSRLLMEIRRPFQGDQGRDAVWDRRRDTRFGRSEPWLPPEIKVFDADKVKFVDRLPNFVIRRIKQRLGINAVQVSVRGRGDQGPLRQAELEALEDWFRGVKGMLDPLDLKDGIVREHQAADGWGCLELEFLPRFTPPSREESEAEDYMKLVADAREEYGLPVRLNAPDPRSIYYGRAGDRLKIVAKVVNVPLYQIQDTWSAEGFRLRYQGDPNAPGPWQKENAIAGEAMSPATTAAEYGRMCRFVLLADESYIYHLLYPNTIPAGATLGPDSFGDALGQAPQLILLGVYPNPIGRPPFFLAGAGRTSDPNPAFEYEPLALENLELAPYTNQLRTMRLMRAYMDALKPVGIEATVPPQDNEEPPNLPAMWRPGFLELPYGKRAVDIPHVQVPDMDKIESWIGQVEQTFNLSLMGAVQSGAIGRSTPAWTSSMFIEEQVSMLKEALDSRANMWREVLEAVAYDVKNRTGRDGPISVRTERRSRADPASGNIDAMVAIDARKLAIPYRLDVSIEALTQSQRASDTEYGRRLFEEGTISQQTYIEDYTPVEDTVMEQRRKDRERLQKQVGDPILLAREKVRRDLRPYYGDLVDIVLGPEPGAAQPPSGGEPAGNVLQGEAANGPRMPGQGLGIALRTPPSVNGNSLAAAGGGRPPA